MPEFVVTRTMDILNSHNKCLKNAKILILGVAYKANVSDTRESPAIEVISLLRDKGADVSYSDPHVRVLRTDGLEMRSQTLTRKLLRETDCAIIITDHKKFDYEFILRCTPAVFDTRNATRRVRAGARNVYVL
jgi:UDP-N-acetyl-D-glucosamine dehydrogenase